MLTKLILFISRSLKLQKNYTFLFLINLMIFGEVNNWTERKKDDEEKKKWNKWEEITKKEKWRREKIIHTELFMEGWLMLMDELS